MLVLLFSCILKPLVKCQYCLKILCDVMKKSWRLAISFSQWNRVQYCCRLNLSPGVTLLFSLLQCLNEHTHPYTQSETSWNCLISPSFNYLPWCPWDRAKGSVLMRGGINRKERQGICSSSPLPALPSPHHLFPSVCFILPLMVNGSDRVCLCVCASKCLHVHK